MRAMLLDPGQREEVRKMLNTGGESLPVTAKVKSVESKSFKRLDKYLGIIAQWREWSFNFLATLQGTNGPTAKALKEVCKQSVAPSQHRGNHISIHARCRVHYSDHEPNYGVG